METFGIDLVKQFELMGFGAADTQGKLEADVKVVQSRLGFNAGSLDETTADIIADVRPRSCDDSPALAFRGGRPKWALDSLSVAVESVARSPYMTSMQFIDAVDAALDSIENACGLKIERKGNSKNANVVIRTGRGRANDFDGPGGKLAYAYMPRVGETGQLEMRFDLDEPFIASLDPVEAAGRIMVQPVTEHEFGHILGLKHRPNNIWSLLRATYDPTCRTYTEHDKHSLSGLYGAPKPKLKPNPRLRPKAESRPKDVKKVVIWFDDGTNLTTR